MEDDKTEEKIEPENENEEDGDVEEETKLVT